MNPLNNLNTRLYCPKVTVLHAMHELVPKASYFLSTIKVMKSGDY